VYGFPMTASYKAMYQLAIDKTSGQFKAPFNTIANDSTTATPKDTERRGRLAVQDHRSFLTPGSAIGFAESSARVWGCCDSETRSAFRVQ